MTTSDVRALIVGPSAAEREAFRLELLTCLDEARNRAADAFANGRFDHGQVYLRCVAFIEEQLRGEMR